MKSSCQTRYLPATRSIPNPKYWKNASPKPNRNGESSKCAPAAFSRKAKSSSITAAASWCGKRLTRRIVTSSQKCRSNDRIAQIPARARWRARARAGDVVVRPPRDQDSRRYGRRGDQDRAAGHGRCHPRLGYRREGALVRNRLDRAQQEEL